MKRIISILLCVVLSAGMLVACGDGKNTNEGKKGDLKGTELAKLLLANERLNSDELSDKKGLLTANRINKLNNIALSTVSDTSVYADNSNMMDYFNSYIEGVESVIDGAAGTIDFIKENVNYTDVWIENGGIGGEVLLEVTDNEEWLYVKADVYKSVSRRYTDENGDDVYEICQTEEDGSYMYLNCIPGKLYEYSFYWIDGNDIHVIVENSRGYWNMFTTYKVEDGRNNVQNLVSADSFAYVYFGEITESSGYTSNNHITFIDPSLSCDLITVHEHDMDINLVGFKGISSFERDDTTNFITSFTTSTGKVINEREAIAEGLNYIFGTDAFSETPYATLTFADEEEGMSGAEVSSIISALSSIGVTCKYDLSAILSGIDASYLIAKNLGSYYSWNGYYVNSYANVQSAISVQKGYYADLTEAYEAVKDAKKIEITSVGINFADYDFAELTLSGSTSVTADGSTVTISGLNASVAPADVMEDGESYELQFALAGLSDVEGEYASAILIPSESNGSATYSGSDLSLTKSANITVPACTETGEYTLVVYIATSQGIRVSKMVPVAFTGEVSYTSVENGYETLIQLNDASEMVVYYTLKSEYEVTLPEGTEYTYNAIYELLSAEAMKYGYPDTTAVLEVYNEDGTAVDLEDSENPSLSTGNICSLQYSIPNAEGFYGHVYVKLP